MNGCQDQNGHCNTNGSSKDHCVAGKIFQTAKQIYVHTGNLTNWSKSNARVVKNTTDEVSQKIERERGSCYYKLRVWPSPIIHAAKILG